MRKDLENRVEVPKLEPVCGVTQLKASSLPKTSGLYLFSSQRKPVFIGQTDDLRHRIERHMDVSASKGLPDWLWDEGPLDLSLAETPGVLKTIRQLTELLLVKKLKPFLNVQRSAA